MSRDTVADASKIFGIFNPLFAFKQCFKILKNSK